jgi:hypothetical protein
MPTKARTFQAGALPPICWQLRPIVALPHWQVLPNEQETKKGDKS